MDSSAPGAERLKGYTTEEITGRHFSRFYTERDLGRAHPAQVLREAAAEGRFEEEGWRVRSRAAGRRPGDPRAHALRHRPPA